MTTFAIALTTAPVDIGAELSGTVFTTGKPAGAADGRGALLLYNGTGNASIYVLIQDAAPDNTSPPGIRVRPGEWFPEEIQASAAGGAWAWASRDDVTATGLVVAWS